MADAWQTRRCTDRVASVMMMLDCLPVGDEAILLLFADMFSSGLERALSCRCRVDGKQRELLLQVGSVAGRTRWLVRSAHQRFKSVTTTPAFVFVERHVTEYSVG